MRPNISPAASLTFGNINQCSLHNHWAHHMRVMKHLFFSAVLHYIRGREWNRWFDSSSHPQFQVCTHLEVEPFVRRHSFSGGTSTAHETVHPRKGVKEDIFLLEKLDWPHAEQRTPFAAPFAKMSAVFPLLCRAAGTRVGFSSAVRQQVLQFCICQSDHRRDIALKAVELIRPQRIGPDKD